MTQEPALEAAGEQCRYRRVGTDVWSGWQLYSPTLHSYSDFEKERRLLYTLPSLSPDVPGLVERLRKESGSEDISGVMQDFYLSEILREAADALASLSLQLAASENLRKSAEEDSNRILKINEEHCKSVNTYIISNARLQDRAEKAEASLSALRKAYPYWSALK